MMIKRNRQSGVTLITSLVMLLVMTIIGLTTIKLSAVDLSVARNYQHQVTAYYAAETTIRKEVSFTSLYEWVLDDNKSAIETSDDGVNNSTSVVDMEKEYSCQGRLNQASSIGPDAPPCRLYRFSIDSNVKGTGADDRHHQGVGKQVPNLGKGSYL